MKKTRTKYNWIANSAKSVRLFILFAAFLVLFGALGVAVASTYDQTTQKDKQLQNLQNDLISAQQKNAELQKERNYYKSDTFIEKEARNTLGLSFPNEDLYIVNHSQPTATATPAPTASTSVAQTASAPTHNPIDEWLGLIFGQ